MTKKEIEAMKEKVKRIVIIESCIRSAENNIKSYDRVFGSREIMIKDNVNKDQKSIFVSGIVKKEILSLLIARQEEIIEKNKKELEDLS